MKTQLTSKRQAKAGGERGANGEWYPGGAFINTVPENPKGAVKKCKPTGRQKVEPDKWEVPPTEGLVAIYPQIAGIEIPIRRAGEYGERAIIGFRFNPNLRHEWATPAAIERRQMLLAKYKAGERWI